MQARSVRHRRDFPEKRAAADEALGLLADTLPEPPVGGHEREWALELGNGVVRRMRTRAQQVGRLLGRISVEDDQELDVLAFGPGAAVCDELLLRDVRPGGATDVLRIDDD
jgi:hypothetical protein